MAVCEPRRGGVDSAVWTLVGVVILVAVVGGTVNAEALPGHAHKGSRHAPKGNQPPPAGKGTVGRVARVAYDAGCRRDGLVTATAVAMAESHGHPTARLVTPREDSRGYWQINTYAYPTWARRNLYDPATNARAMYAISGGCRDWRAWSTWQHGSHRPWLRAARAAAARAA